MSTFAGFQQSVYYPNVAYAGDVSGLPPYNPTKGYIVDAASFGGGIYIGSFCYGLAGSLNNTQVTQIKGSNTAIAGFVPRLQDGVWADANVPFGYSMLMPSTRQIQVAAKGTFYAVCPSLNGGGVIVQGDIIVINDTTGALASQTSTTIPSGYHQAISGGVAWTVINAAPTSQTASGYPINNAGVTANLVVISNVATY